MTHSHEESKRCDVCKVLWFTCRCPKPKVEKLETCPDCLRKANPSSKAV